MTLDLQKPTLLPRPLSNALERPKTLPPPVPPPKPPAPLENLNPEVEHIESPEKLSLKARLKLFEKEIEQQGAAPAPKPGTPNYAIRHQCKNQLDKTSILYNPNEAPFKSLN